MKGTEEYRIRRKISGYIKSTLSAEGKYKKELENRYLKKTGKRICCCCSLVYEIGEIGSSIGRCCLCRRMKRKLYIQTERNRRKKNIDKVSKHKDNYYKKNKKEINKRNMDRYRLKNKEERRRIQRLSYLKNREVRILDSKRRRLKNKERFREYCLKYYKENKDKIKVWSHNSKIKRGKMIASSNDGTVTHRSIKELGEKQGWICVECSIDIKKSYTLDHCKSLCDGGAHSIDNIQLMCGPCNSRKSKKSYKIIDGERFYL